MSCKRVPFGPALSRTAGAQAIQRHSYRQHRAKAANQSPNCAGLVSPANRCPCSCNRVPDSPQTGTFDPVSGYRSACMRARVDV